MQNAKCKMTSGSGRRASNRRARRDKCGVAAVYDRRQNAVLRLGRGLQGSGPVRPVRVVVNQGLAWGQTRKETRKEALGTRKVWAEWRGGVVVPVMSDQWLVVSLRRNGVVE